MRVTLTGGEVALREDWLTIADAVKRHGMVLSVLTNGTLLTESDLHRLAQLHPWRVAVSIYGATAVGHDRVTGVAGSFERSVRALRGLRSRQVRCRVSCTLMPDTFPHVDGVVGLAETLGCEYMFDSSVAPGADGDLSVLEYRLDAEQVGEWFGDRGLIQRPDAGAHATDRSQPTTRKAANCDAGVTSIYLDAGGQHSPAWVLRRPLG